MLAFFRKLQLEQMSSLALTDLLADVARCDACSDLPLGPRPVLRAAETARLLIIGQAPGTRVYASGIPWDDPSGERLRDWLAMDRDSFYDSRRIAIMPMAFCYPGRGKSGDLPPPSNCAPLWHARVKALLPDIRLTLLIGQYAQNYYLDKSYPGKPQTTLTQRVASWRDYLPEFFPLVHPSPRNSLWLKRNPWFEQEVVPALREQLSFVLQSP